MSIIAAWMPSKTAIAAQGTKKYGFVSVGLVGHMKSSQEPTASKIDASL